MKRLLLFLYLSAAASAAVFADDGYPKTVYRIEGRVTGERGEPLAGVSVWVVGTINGVATNAKGEFLIRIREKRDVRLRFSYTGYRSREIEVKMGDESRMEVKMAPAKNCLDEVVVTGSRTEKPLKDTPILTRVITQKDISVHNPPDIETLLQYELPGLQIVQNSMSLLPAIRYQGVDGRYMLFLVDGERISGEGADHNIDFSRLNIDDIERVEIIKGSQSAVYGSNALGGVINIITKKSERPFTGNIAVRYAGVNGRKYTLSGGIKRKNFSSLTSFTWRKQNTYTIGDTSEKVVITLETPEGEEIKKIQTVNATTVYGGNIWNATQKLGYDFSDKLRLDIKGTYYHNKNDLRFGRLYRDLFSDRSVSAQFKYIPVENRQMNFLYIYDRYKKDKDYFRAGVVTTDYRNITRTFKADYEENFNAHCLSAGAEVNRERLKHYMHKDSSTQSVDFYAFYLQDNWEVVRNLNFIAALRADYHRKYHWHFTPKLNLMYAPCKAFTLRAGYSQGFRSPSLKELYMDYDMGGQGFLQLVGNPDLKPETSRQYSLSAETTAGGLNFSLSFYHNRFKDQIVWVYWKTENDMAYNRTMNAETSKTRGMEAILNMKLGSGITLRSSYAYVDDCQKVEGRNISYVRPHSVTFRGMYAHRFGRTETVFSFHGQWGSRLKTHRFLDGGKISSVSFKGRLMCSLNAACRFPRGVSFMLGVDNLFNHKDKSSESSVLQIPRKGIAAVATLNVNIADMLKL